MTIRRPHPLLWLVSLAFIALAGCGEIVERAKPKPQIDRLNESHFALDVDPMMRGTIASETIVTGFSPTVVRGYGLVVGLNGTGSRLMPAEVRAHMLQEMARKGVGSISMGGGDLTPEGMLDSEDCAVVIVEGVIPPGSPEGSTFDVRVFSVPGSGTQSLEGGRLWTTELRAGPLLTGSRQGRILAEAKGPLFINPFVEPNATTKSAVNKLSGRILDGGTVNDDMLLRLRLATTSHSRAKTIESAINSMYPREPGQKDQTARGRTGDAIDVVVPLSYHDEPDVFVQLVQHTPMLVEAPEQTAMYVRRALLAAPGMAEAASWRWRALGKKAVPMIQDLYTYPEEQIRMAALVAGANLDDPLSTEPLLEMARTGEQKNRLVAIELLGKMGMNPAIEIGLRPLLDDDDVDVRLATFEALDVRRDPTIGRAVVDGQFALLLVPSTKPMIYISQTGQPKIVVFGRETQVERPLTFTTWSNRLMIKANENDSELQVYWRPRESAPPEIKDVRPELAQLVPFLGHRTTIEQPTPGLGLTYSETIGALHELWLRGYVKADFKAEQDRILAAIIRSQKPDEVLDRPEFDDPGPIEGASDGASLATNGGSRPASHGSDLATLGAPDSLGAIPGAPVAGASGATRIERTGVQRDTVPR